MKRKVLILGAAAIVALSQSNRLKPPFAVDPNRPSLPAGWTLEETPGVAVDAREHVSVFHRGKHSIIELDEAGKVVVRTRGDGVFVRPHGLRFDNEGNLWAADDLGHIVVKMDALSRIRMVLGRKNFKGETNDTFNRPTDLAFTPSGDFYMADGYGNSRVVKFDKEGEFIRAWGKKGTGRRGVQFATRVAVDKRGRVYAGDRENHRMKIFDSDGKFLANRIPRLNKKGEIPGVLGAPGKLPGQLDFSHDKAIGPSGNIYVAEIKELASSKVC